MRTPEHYRQRAEQIRGKAAMTKDPFLREELEGIAEEYVALAANVEAALRAAHHPD